VAKTWPAFRSLWRESGMGLDLQSGGSRIALAQREQAYLLAFRDEAAKGDRGATSPLGGVAQ